MKRRLFIKVFFTGIIASLAGWYIFDFKRVARGILVSDTKKFKFSQANAVDQFVKEAEREQFWRQFSWGKRIFICLQHFAHSMGIFLPYQSKYFQYRSAITGH